MRHLTLLLAIFTLNLANLASFAQPSDPAEASLEPAASSSKPEPEQTEPEQTEPANPILTFLEDNNIAYRGDFSFFSGATAYKDTVAPTFTLKSQLELGYSYQDFSFSGVIDPVLSFTGVTNPSDLLSSVTFDPGLSELYALYRQGDIDISLGKERLPLEAARLSLPFSLEQRLPTGAINGLWGARLLYFPDDYRIRAAAFYHKENFGAEVSAKYFFGDFELEAHAVYSDGFNIGVTGSGLLDNIVLYGEAWWLSNAKVKTLSNLQASYVNEAQWRVLLGVNGFIDTLVWTLEAGYLPLAEQRSIVQVLGQLSIPNVGLESVSMNLNGALRFPETGMVGTLGATVNWLEGDNSRELLLQLELAAQQQPRLTLGWRTSGYY